MISSGHTPTMRQPFATGTRNPLKLLTLLTLDLLLEILYRLPVKSLLKLKCVCKSLNSIISDPKFVKDHLRLSRTSHYHHHVLICPEGFILRKEFILFDSQLPSILNNSTSTIQETMLKFPERVLNFPSNPRYIDPEMIDSCDGMVCFKTYSHNYGHNYHVDMVVWNPSTGKLKTLPPLYLPNHTNHTLYSFGYDRFTDTYKIIAVACYQFYDHYFCKTHVKVHTLGTNFWRRIPDFPSEHKRAPGGLVGKFVGGSINWIINYGDNPSSSCVILSLDLGNESYQEILQPDFGLDERVDFFSLEVSRDCLCVLAYTKTFLDIWVMKDYGNKDSWTKLVTVPFAKFIDYYACASLLYIYEEDDQVLLDFRDKVYLYNYKNGSVKILEVQGLPSTMFTSIVYVESLISP